MNKILTTTLLALFTCMSFGFTMGPSPSQHQEDPYDNIDPNDYDPNDQPSFVSHLFHGLWDQVTLGGHYFNNLQKAWALYKAADEFKDEADHIKLVDVGEAEATLDPNSPHDAKKEAYQLIGDAYGKLAGKRGEASVAYEMASRAFFEVYQANGTQMNNVLLYKQKSEKEFDKAKEASKKSAEAYKKSLEHENLEVKPTDGSDLSVSNNAMQENTPMEDNTESEESME